MKEIHAYQNDDGTYRVEIFGVKFTEQTLGKGRVRTTIESRIEVPKATLSITALASYDKDEKNIFTITVE